MPRRNGLRRFAPIPLALALAGLAPLGTAAAQNANEFGCPRYVDVAPMADVNAPVGWSAGSLPTRRWLRGAEMFEGDPAANERIR